MMNAMRGLSTSAFRRALSINFNQGPLAYARKPELEEAVRDDIAGNLTQKGIWNNPALAGGRVDAR